MGSKKIAILQSNYIPWKGYFDMIANVDVFVIYDEVQYTKNDWRNRNIIKTKNGLQWLTIAVRQESLSQAICETLVFKTNWTKKHIGTLQANYSKAPYFSDYKDRIFKIYENASINLSEINISFIKEICAILEIDTKIIDSRSLNLTGDKQERLVQACKQLNADTYLSGPAAKNYIDEDFFSNHQINVEWMDYSNYKTYNQLHPPFEHRVSILDLIFNEGPNAKKYLKSYT
ncbi:WbqC family protein [Psychroserpens sp. SPM9]|uniref:WbqC family protein n=1 Tax=Psychroserpens sp. SPM9 TaxID=2975598 RepID=UPI0021A871B2|nr:WbqC family protein [Psychroserpens sp. SPM9]MDG5492259.1 WbqC family protein [Psychroserpens sp. SPM9]